MNCLKEQQRERVHAYYTKPIYQLQVLHDQHG